MMQSTLRANETPKAALMTPRGRGALATIRFVGDSRLFDHDDAPLFRAANGKPLHNQPLNRTCFGHWSGQVREEVVVCRTDDLTTDVHCHGGDAAVRRILDDLKSVGCGIVSWQELTTETAGRFEAECLEALSRATTLRTSEILLRQQSGILKAAFEELHSLSVPRMEKSGTPDKGTRAITDSRQLIQQALDDLLVWANFGLHLTRSWKVVIAGRPNVGKSSLINALVGYSRSIVYDQPGTTRDVVTADTALDGWPIQLADTAGIRDAADQSEAAGVAFARRQLQQADCRMLLFDTSVLPHPDDTRLMAEWPDAILVAHKCDLTDVWGTRVPNSAIRVSSANGEGIDALSKLLLARLVPETPDPTTPIPVTNRQAALLNTARATVAQNDMSECRQALVQLLH